MPSYSRPESLSLALSLLASGHRVLAGGTDIYTATGPMLTADVVDITGIAALQGIQTTDGLRIGAATTWRQIADATLPPALFALQQAARVIGGRQIQNAGTIGGNLCNASPAADGIPPLLVLQAEVEIVSSQSTRHIPLESYLKGGRRVDLRPGELLAAIVIPPAALLGKSSFAKLGARSHLVISIVMVALRLVVSPTHIHQAFAAVGSCSATAQRLPLIEAALAGAPLNHAARLILPSHLAALTPIDDIRATAEYRLTAVAVLLRRAVRDLTT